MRAVIGYEDCRALDAADPLAPLRDLFHLPEGTVYLDGNSLGALPRNVPDRIRQVVEDEWGRRLILGWRESGWLDLPKRVGARLESILGAEPGSVVACDSTTINLHKAVAAALDINPGRILTDSGNFPTDLYVLQSLSEPTVVHPEEILDAITPGMGVVALTEVDYRTGRRHDIATVTEAAHRAGALTVWDLSHSAGVLPLDLATWGVDMAVGCGYKYLNGGPGAPAYVYVAPRHLERLRNPIVGWFAHADPFSFSPEFVPAPGIDRLRVGTPHILSLAALDAALDVFDGVDMERVWAKARSLTETFIRLIDQQGLDLEVVTPRDPDRRGAQVSLRHPRAQEAIEALIDRGVIGDFRTPDLLRFGFAPLYVRYVDVWRAVEAIAEVLGR
jgi:kynureninase